MIYIILYLYWVTLISKFVNFCVIKLSWLCNVIELPSVCLLMLQIDLQIRVSSLVFFWRNEEQNLLYEKRFPPKIGNSIWYREKFLDVMLVWRGRSWGDPHPAFFGVLDLCSWVMSSSARLQSLWPHGKTTQNIQIVCDFAATMTIRSRTSVCMFCCYLLSSAV